MFNFLKKKGVPDVGQEEDEAIPEEQLIGGDDSEEEVEEPRKLKREKRSKGKRSKKGVRSIGRSEGVSESNSSSDLKIEKLKGKIEMLNSLVKGLNERLSVVGQQVGEVRNMSLENEKTIVRSTKDSSKAVDVLKEVKPEELKVSYQKMDLRMQSLNEKLEASHQFNDNLMNEVKELKRKAGVFVGTDGVLKLNEEVKKDLIEVQKMVSKTRLNSDKSEQIFMEIRKGFAEGQKLNKILSGLDVNYSGIKKEIEKLKVDYSELVNYKDFGDNQKKMDNNFAALESSLSKLDSVSKNNARLSALIEKIFMLARNNEKDISNIAVSLGDTKVKKASDYEERFRLLLGIVDEMGDELGKIKKKTGVKGGGKKPKAVMSLDGSEETGTELKEKNSSEEELGSEEGKSNNVDGEGKEVAPVKKSFFKRLFSSKKGSPIEEDLKAEGKSVPENNTVSKEGGASQESEVVKKIVRNKKKAKLRKGSRVKAKKKSSEKIKKSGLKKAVRKVKKSGSKKVVKES
jgi:hypothetical protein